MKNGLVYTNEKCIGCNKCIRSCSCIGACVSTEADENGVSRIEVDGSLCVACGACFDVSGLRTAVFLLCAFPLPGGRSGILCPIRRDLFLFCRY